MAKIQIGLLQVEVEEAIKQYVSNRVRAGYDFELDDLQVSINPPDENGRITCDIYSMINEKEVTNG